MKEIVVLLVVQSLLSLCQGQTELTDVIEVNTEKMRESMGITEKSEEIAEEVKYVTEPIEKILESMDIKGPSEEAVVERSTEKIRESAEKSEENEKTVENVEEVSKEVGDKSAEIIEDTTTTTRVPEKNAMLNFFGNCPDATKITLTVNLQDRDCVREARSYAVDSTISEDEGKSENSVEMTEIEMDAYAVCILKKSSIMDDEASVNLNFDIYKIIRSLYKKTDDKGIGVVLIIKSLENCRYLSGVNEYATAAKIIKCLIDNQETVVWCNQ